MSRRILVAMDESENAMRAVDYVKDAFSKDCEILLFGVVQNVSGICGMEDPSLTPYFQARQIEFCAIEDQKRGLMEKALNAARDRLIEAGFDESLVKTEARVVKEGVARDIVREADSGYDTVVLGRRGLSGIRQFILGSVSQKVLSAIKNKAVVMVD